MIFTDERRRRGNVLVTPAVQMTAAASGSSGIVVADSDEYDFGAGDFGIVWEGSRTTWRPAGVEFIDYKTQDGNNYIQLFLLPDGTIQLAVAVAGNIIFAKTTAEPIPESYAGRVIQLVFSVVRETASTAGSFTPYMDAAALGAAQSIAAAATTSISNTAITYIMGTDAARYASNTVSFILLNFAPTAQQVSTLYSSGIPAEWMWGSNVNLLPGANDFSSATWGKSANGTGSAPVVTAGAGTDPVGGSNASKIVFDRGAGNSLSDSSNLFQGNIPTTIGKQYLGSLWLKAWGAPDVGKQISIRHVGSAGYTVFTLTADWVLFDGVETCGLSLSGFDITNRGGITADNSVSVLAYTANLNQLGATLALLPETIPISPALEWPDSSTNGNDGTLPAAGATKVVIRR